MGLKENIKKYRLQNNLTLDDVAKKVGVTLQTIQKYEKGTISNIPQDKIEKLSEIFHTTPSKLMGWDDINYSFTNDDGIELHDRLFSILSECEGNGGNIYLSYNDILELFRLESNRLWNHAEFAAELYEIVETSSNVINDLMDYIKELTPYGVDTIDVQDVRNIVEFLQKIHDKIIVIPGKEKKVNELGINYYYEKLNDIGKIEAAKRVEELTYIDKYKEGE